ncbi:hypothetical protein HHI36_008333, partial [Cryptolaemus montrouzieri]
KIKKTYLLSIIIDFHPKISAQKADKKKEYTNKTQNDLKDVTSNYSPSFVLDYDQITDLLQNIEGSISIIQNYTQNYAALLDMLTKIYPFAKERYGKTRITKLREILLKLLDV